MLCVGGHYFSLESTIILVEDKVMKYVGDALVFFGAGIMLGYYLA